MPIQHAIRNIKKYKKKHGLGKALRATIHYLYIGTKKIKKPQSNNGIIEVNGYKMKVMLNDPFGTSNELLLFNTHEPISTQLISKELKNGMTVLDIGGNIGYYVLLEHKCIGNNGKIIAIEPSPDNFKILEDNLALQNISNVQAYNIAAGDKDGQLNFLIYKDASNSCMVIPEGQEERWPGDKIKVPVRKMDQFINELKLEQIDFVRMDVEGYELHIIKGMKESLSKFKPKIHIEVHKNILGKENVKKFFQVFKELGYESKYYIPRDLDTPLIGTLNDVKNYTLDELENMLHLGKISNFFMLTLEVKS